MSDMAHTEKIMTKLKLRVIEYFVEKHENKFPVGTSWESLVQLLPPLQTEVEMSKLRSAVGEVFLSNLLKRYLPKETFPLSMIFKLDALYCKELGGFARTRMEPYLAFHSDNLMQTMMPEMREAAPICPLAIVDFSRNRQHEWTEAEIFVLLQYVVELSRNATIVVVFTVHPGWLAANILLSLKRFGQEKKLDIHIEYGSYFREDMAPLEGQFFSGANYLCWNYHRREICVEEYF